MLNSLRQAFAERGWDRNGSRDHETQRPRQTPRGQSGEECKYRQTDPDAETQRPEYHYQEDGFDGTKRNGARRKDGSGFETKQQIEVAGVEDRSNWRKTGWVDRKWTKKTDTSNGMEGNNTRPYDAQRHGSHERKKMDTGNGMKGKNTRPYDAQQHDSHERKKMDTSNGMKGENTRPYDAQRHDSHERKKMDTGNRIKGKNTRPGNAQRHDSHERKFPIGCQELLQLANEDPNVILFRIASQTSGFPKLLSAANAKSGTIELAVSVMVKACTCRSSPACLVLLLNNLRTSIFLSQAVTSYIAGMTASNINIRCVRDLLTLLRELLSRFTHSGRASVLPVFATLEYCVTSIKEAIRASPSSSDLSEEIDSVVADVKEMKELMVRKEKETTRSPGDPWLPEERETAPADDFRALSVFPTLEDIHFRGDVFLRRNKVRGVYEDLDHYLDVQFRLLREDFVQPLRKGIQEYLDAGAAGARHNKFQDILVYTNVHILEPVLTHGGMAVRVEVDATRMAKVKWETSKRLIYGSMVCLSKDDFKTVIFATVEERDAKKLVKGELVLRALGDDAVLDVSHEDAYVMVETTAYFEAYRHVLDGLQQVDEDSFAFARYIVRCEAEPRPPAYLVDRGQPLYDLSCLAVSEVPDPSMRAVPVMQLRLWPAAEAVGMDASQLRAIQAALTREFAIIQGPPGTGKTYVGLKIVQTLLENRNMWSGAGLQKSVILIVCFTNHALDQFLEGINMFLKSGIVRVGGRSKSELIQSFSLDKTRQNTKLPRHLYDMRSKAAQDVAMFREVMEENASRISTTYNNVIRTDVLEPYMNRNHVKDIRGESIGDWLRWDGRQMQNATDAEQITDAADSDDEATIDESTWEPNNNREDADQRRTGELRREKMKRQVEGELVDKVALQRDENPERWQIQKAQLKRHKKHTRRMIRQTGKMSDEEEARVENIWALPMQHRWRLYRKWVAEYRRALHMQLSEKGAEYEDAVARLKEVHSQIDLHVLQTEATVLGMTTSGAARNRSLLQELQPKIIIVEEAAEVFESHIVTTLNGHCEHLILIGDHKQLRPKPNVYELAQKYNLKISLFERMFNNGVPCEALELQHRMRPEISKLLHPIYPALRDHPKVLDYDQVMGVSTNMFFVEHNENEQHDGETRSHKNPHEASFIARLCRYLLLQGYTPDKITVLTTYSGQLFELRARMPKTEFAGVRVCVVDNYQGEENDIVLLSLVRSNDSDNMGFLTEDNRVCVALSRARVGFYVIGNFRMFARKSKLWQKLVTSLGSSGAVGEKLALYCQNHPDRKRLQVSTADDFDNAPEGGCLMPCDARLPCGHVCEMVCHVYDKQHEEYKCKKPCVKVLCEEHHVCRRMCHERCGKCEEMVDKIVPGCGHTQKVPCHLAPRMFSCRHQVLQHFPCGHSATLSCNDCSTAICHKLCDATLACGHRCRGTCSGCHTGRLHVPCQNRCERILVCGHECTDMCSVTCSPCREPCRNRCAHSRCLNACGEPCAPCLEPCSWICGHYQCSKLCHEQCDRKRCPHSCAKLLECGHPCIGVCGEPCPDKCRICDREEVCEIFFGDEDEPGAKFVQLEDCGHALEVDSLDRWMDQSDGASDIALKRCPKCKTLIQRSLRYGAIVNKTLIDVETVKRRIIGDETQIADTKRRAMAALGGLLDRAGMRDCSKALISRLQHQARMPGCSKELNEMMSRLQHPSLNLEEAVCIEYISNLLSVVSDLEKAAAADLKVGALHDNIRELKEWALISRRQLGEQEMMDAGRETKRLSHATLAAKLRRSISTAGGEIGSSLRDRFYATDARLNRGQPLSDRELEEAESTLKEVRTKAGHIGVLTSTERLQVVKAMGLSQGHWFKCPNGHIYAIGECGGAVEEAKCPECKATIGGTSHELSSGNRLAPEMDGAQHAAWSDTANMQNYRLDLDD